MTISPTQGISKLSYSGISLNESSGGISELAESNLIADYPLLSTLTDTVNGYTATLTRSTTKLFIKDDNTLSTAAIDSPSYTGSGILLDPAATNIYTYSNDWVNAVWARVRNFTSTADTTGPDGTLSAGYMQANATNSSGAYVSRADTMAAGDQYTFKLVAKYDSCPFVLVQLFDNAVANGLSQWFDLQNHTFGSSVPTGSGWSAASTTVRALPEGFYEYTVVFNKVGTICKTWVYATTADTMSDCVNGQKFYYDNISLQENNSSYIKNATTAVQRPGDALAVPTTGFPTNAFAYYLEYEPVVTPDIFSQYVLANTDGVNNLVGIYFTDIDSWAVQIQIGGVTIATVGLTKTIVAGTTYKILLRVSAGETYFEIDDGTSTSATGTGATDIINSTFYLGTQNGVDIINGYVRNFKCIPSSTITLAQAESL